MERGRRTSEGIALVGVWWVVLVLVLLGASAAGAVGEGEKVAPSKR